MIKFYQADIINFLNELPDRSVSCWVLDPPYYKVVNEEWDKQWVTLGQYLEWCESWIQLIEKKSKLSATMWYFGFSRQLAHTLPILEKYNYEFRQQIIIWKGMKSAAGRTSSKLKMFPTTTEHIYYLCYDSIDYIKGLLNAKKKEAGLTSKALNEYLGKASNGGGTWSTIAGPKQMTPQQPTREDWGKLAVLFGGLPEYDDIVYPFNLPMGITDVWDDINFYIKNRIHPTQKPVDCVKRIIQASTNEKSLVCDPFMGSGTTAVVCQELDRDFVGCELEPQYIKICEDRLHLSASTQG